VIATARYWDDATDSCGTCTTTNRCNNTQAMGTMTYVAPFERVYPDFDLELFQFLANLGNWVRYPRTIETHKAIRERHTMRIKNHYRNITFKRQL